MAKSPMITVPPDFHERVFGSEGLSEGRYSRSGLWRKLRACASRYFVFKAHSLLFDWSATPPTNAMNMPKLFSFYPSNGALGDAGLPVGQAGYGIQVGFMGYQRGNG